VIDTVLLTTLVCQSHLYKKAAEDLDRIIATLPK
jgi:hypothetical protein